jgi:hypothetical protein
MRRPAQLGHTDLALHEKATRRSWPQVSQRCAMQEHYEPAWDHDGNAIPGLTKSIRVRFER